jgi:hypothetical protein
MRTFLRFISILVLLASFVCDAHATKRYWVGATSNSWKTTANWASSSGGAGGASIPGSNDTAIFDGSATSRHRCNLDSLVNVKRLAMTGDTLSQGSYTITLGTSGGNLTGGTFLGGSASITVSGTFTIAGCAFTSTSGTFSTSGNFTFSSGSFTHNSGMLEFTASNTITGSMTLYQLNFNPSSNATYTIASGTTLTVNNTLTLAGSNTITLNTGAISAKGNISLTNTGTNGTGTATITINGTGTQTITGGGTTGRSKLPKVVINKSASDTLKLASIVSVAGNWTYTAGVISPGTSTVYFANTLTITGSHTLYNVSFSGGATRTYTIASGTTLTVNGTLTTDQSNAITLNTGTINAKGDIKISNTSTASGGSATININGTGNQSFTGNNGVGYGALGKVVINKSAGTLTLDSIISVTAGWTYTAGTLSTGTSTVAFYDNAQTITGTHTLKNVTFYNSSGAYTYTIASGTTLTVNGTLTLDGSTGITLNTGTINAKENVNLTNTSNAGGGTATIVLNGSGTQTITGAALGVAGRLPKVTINKSSDTLKLISTIPVTGDWTYTSGVINAGTSQVAFLGGGLTITGSHTLNDVRFGSASTFVIASGTTLTINGTTTYGTGSGAIIINTGTVNAKGDISLGNPSTGGGGSATIVVNGTGSQAITGNSTGGNSALPNLTINKSSGTLSLASTITVAGNWTWTAGTISPGSSTIYFIGTKTITGSHTLGDVTFDGSSAATYTIASGTTLTASGTLTINGTAAVTLSTGEIDATGNITVTNTATTATGSVSLVINGTGNQTLTGSGVAGQGRLPKITIDKTAGVLTLASVISVYGDWIYTKGSVAEGTSSVALYGTSNLDGQISGGSAMMRFYSLAISADTRSLTGNIDVNKNFTIASGATLSAGGNSIFLAGNWNSQGTWTYGTSNVIFDSTGYKQISGASGAQVNFYDVTFKKQYSLSSPSSLTLVRPLKINHTATFTEGHIKATSTNYFEFANGATLVGGSDSAYVHGPVRKTGNDAFTFPLGDTTLADDAAYHPFAITAPSSTSDQFEARYFPQMQTYGDSLVDSLSGLTNDEYWTLERKIGSSNVTATISWNRNSSIDNYDDLRVANWNGTYWKDLGAATVTVSSSVAGNITAAIQVDFTISPSPITHAKKNTTTPYFTLQRKLDGDFYYVSNGRLLFKYDEEYNDADHKLTFSIYGDHNNLLTSDALLPASMMGSIYTVYGDNRYELNLANCAISPNGYLPNGYYVLEVMNEKNEKRYLRFKNTSALIYTNCSPNPN